MTPDERREHKPLPEIQTRRQGECVNHRTVQDAMNVAGWEKISFTVPDGARVVLWSDGTYEIRTPEGLRAMALDPARG